MKNDIGTYRPDDERLNGIYRGVIEDNKDPEKMGRCKIRVFGIHTPSTSKDDLDGIPTDELPWSEPALGLFEGSVSGYGGWTIPLQGSHVFLFFENGHMLKPRYFASAPGVPTETGHGYDDGFSDPDGEFPTENRLDEPDWHRLSRDESEETIVTHKEDNLDTGIKLALEQGEWNEPSSFYLKSSDKYPNNIVYATHNGLLVEMDTSDNPRFHLYHPSNSYIEIDDEGNKVIRNEGNRYDIIMKDFYKHILFNDHTTIDENKTENIGNDKYVEIGNDNNTEIGNDNNTIIGNNKTTEIGNNNTIIIVNDEEKTIGRNKIENITDDLIITVDGNKNVTISGECNITVTGNCNITSHSTVNINGGPVINLNT